jgi:hypothetical protein
MWDCYSGQLHNDANCQWLIRFILRHMVESVEVKSDALEEMPARVSRVFLDDSITYLSEH